MKFTTAFLVVAAAGSAALANPVYTTIGGPGETGIANIFQNGSWGGLSPTSVSQSGNDFILSYAGGDQVRARRLADARDNGGPIDLVLASSHIASSNDQVFRDGTVISSVHARFAGYEQQFGYIPVATGVYQSLFTVTPGGTNGFPPAISGSSNGTINSRFAFARRGTSGNANGGDTWSSTQGNNSDQQDHLITYLFENISGSRFSPNTLALFWDDQAGGGDRDFNDLAVEIHVAQIVPLPTAALASMAGLGGLAFIRRRRMA